MIWSAQFRGFNAKFYVVAGEAYWAGRAAMKARGGHYQKLVGEWVA